MHTPLFLFLITFILTLISQSLLSALNFLYSLLGPPSHLLMISTLGNTLSRLRPPSSAILLSHSRSYDEAI
ncbi:hypothetical protein Syun_007585 [Stephania yunnanensis]|uniref:Uncharacterized protein n=1 Tax=Stephania yunnanensis TaxID=152371 RepID=A0AAP0Q0E3_9MAGN